MTGSIQGPNEKRWGYTKVVAGMWNGKKALVVNVLIPLWGNLPVAALESQSNVSVSNYTEGTFIIDMIDPEFFKIE